MQQATANGGKPFIVVIVGTNCSHKGSLLVRETNTISRTGSTVFSIVCKIFKMAGLWLVACEPGIRWYNVIPCDANSS